MKRSIIFLALMWALAACDKETTISIPETIAGTAWAATKGDGSHISLVFDAETYSLERYEPNDGKTEQTAEPNEEQPAKTRTYRYERPRVELLEGSEVILSGEITTDGKSYLMMSLHNADNNIVETLFKVK
ncbi:MAG: hypothetical protein K2L06_03975 [Alistipes sp.]|nr:hypothetical protein [Alistipes sp.]